MPNHTYNTVKVTGTAEAVARFREKAKGEERVISYWNFKTPPQEAIDSGEYWATNGWSEGERTGDTPNNWYNFNNREWGTKWDTYEDEVVFDKDTEVCYSFASAWSPPLPVFEAMAQQHPDLEFEFEWEEEQGWGGEATGTNGAFAITKEWDIPNSHADHDALGKECDMCVTWYADNPEEWYDDCPRPEEK